MNDQTERFKLSWNKRAGLRWVAWQGAGVMAAFPTREGGVSPAPYSALNLGMSTDDARVNVFDNRRRLCAALGLPLERLVVPGQVHGTVLAEVGETEAGRGTLDPDDVIEETDSLMTAVPGLGLAVSYADCVPVVIVARAPDGGALLATVHAGWRGMIDGIVGQAARALARRGRLLGAVVGPSIGPCCFAMDDALRARFAARFPGSAGAATVDLWRCARQELEAAGVPPDGVAVTGICTASDARFFSHRRDRGLTGRHLAIAWRQEERAAR
jgi:polyphenol oxidase